MTCWYVVTSWTGGYKNGTLATTLCTNKNWFPLKNSADFIKKDNSFESVIILSFQKITKAQYDEFNPTEPTTNPTEAGK